jgi:hypothetical protein
MKSALHSIAANLNEEEEGPTIMRYNFFGAILTVKISSDDDNTT